MLVLTLFACASLALYTRVLGKLYLGLKNLAKQPQTLPAIISPPKVSIMVAIRNEEQDLPGLLFDLESQSYPREQMQWVLINDRSTDHTSEILKFFSNRYPQNCSVITLSTPPPAKQSPKKRALSEGYQACTGQIILSTDADCRVGNDWVTQLVNSFTSESNKNSSERSHIHGTGMALGLTLYQKRPEISNLFWEMQAMDFLGQGLVSAGLIGSDFPINGNANNMAYAREAFETIGGMESHRHITSGDDDFLLQKIHQQQSWGIRFLTDSASQVFTRPCLTIKELWEQRKRWASKTGMYSKDRVRFLSTIFIHYCVVFALMLAACFYAPIRPLAFVFWLHKAVADLYILKMGAKIFKVDLSFKYYPLAAIIHPPLIVMTVLFGSFGSFRWKGHQSIRGKSV